MLNRPWIDQRNVDWTQAPNPYANPGWSPYNNPFVHACLQDVYAQALRNAKGIEARIYVGPENPNLLIPPGSTQDYDVPIEPNFWLYAIKASSRPIDERQPSFLFNIIDSLTGAALFTMPASSADLNILTTSPHNRGPQHFLATPHLFASPGYPVIRIINTDAAAQICRVTLFGAVEYDV